MNRYFLFFSYDGTAYHGWQVQPNGNSVQAELQHALSVLLRQPIEVVGAGRTDAGVHAAMMVAHFDLSFPPQGDLERGLVYRLNGVLPHDIAIHRIYEVPDDMHARFSATMRTYHYYVSTQRDPFNRQYTWQCHYDLDFALMNEAASLLTRLFR